MPPALDRHVVTAVLVAHQGGRWLPETLKALLTQTRPVQRFVAVDTGSTDRGPAVLTEVVGEGNLLRLPPTTGYGEAVARALRHRAAALPVPDEQPGEPRTEWIWLLHDDSAPATDALAVLLEAADADPGAAVLGPKLRDWNDRRVLLELGVTIDGAGRRETGVERLEFDQGQHDGIRTVLAVSTAGMLVRRDVWEQLGGLDPEFGLFRDDLDFGWRAHAAGHRVVAVGDAVVYHAEASARGQRDIGIPIGSPRRRDRRNALYVLLANLPTGPAWRALARNVLGTALRVLGLLAAKRQVAARDELAALGEVLRAPGRLRRARAARAEGRRRVYHTVRRFQARGVALRRFVEQVAAWVYREDHQDEEHSDAPKGPSLLRRVLSHPSAVVVLGLGALALAAERTLVLAGGRLGGGALVPAWGGASDLWERYAASWHPVGLGSAEQAPPALGALAALSTLTLGKPWLAVSILLLGSVPLAGLTAYLAARALVAEPPPPRSGRRALRRGGRRVPLAAVRVWAAVTYALLPVATGAVATGRLGTAVVLVLLPLIVWQTARMYGLPRHRALPPKQRRRAAWAVALLLTVAMAFVPLVWPLALLGGLLVRAAFDASRTRRVDRKLLVALGVPPLVLLPWTLSLLRHPSRFLLEPGLLVGGVPAPDALSLLTLNPGGPGTPPPWALCGMLLPAVLALLLRAHRTVVLVGWVSALFALLTAIGVSAATVSKGAERALAWPGAALLLAAAGLLTAATATVLRAAEALAGKDLLTRLGGGLVALAALTAPVLAGLSWVADGAGGPLRKVPGGTVPGFIDGPAAPRTLALSRDERGRVAYTVLRGTEPRLGDPDTPADTAARHRMDALVAALAAGHGDGPALTRMGVQYVLVPRPAQDPTTTVLDASPALTRLSRTDEFGIWRLSAFSGRLLLIEGARITPLPTGPVGASVRIPPGTGSRTLLLAEPADGGWRATLDGTGLPARRMDGWALAYDVPAGGGHFELHREERRRHIWLAVQGAAVLTVAVLALPGARSAALPLPGRTRRPGGRRARHASRARRGDTPAPPATRRTESPVAAGETP